MNEKKEVEMRIMTKILNDRSHISTDNILNNKKISHLH